MRQLDQHLTGYRVYLKYAIPDAVLFHMGIDVLEQGGTVLTIARTRAPRAAVANARAAFESSLDMLLLLAEPTLYDEMGALARACELLTWEDLRRKRAVANEALGLPAPPPSPTPEDTVESEAKKWEPESPGVGTMYRRVLAQARTDGRWKHHWSGHGTLVERARAIAQKWSVQRGFVETAEVLWSLQSVHAHPGPRTGMRRFGADDKGRVTISPKPDDALFPLTVTGGACEHAIRALERRATLVT